MKRKIIVLVAALFMMAPTLRADVPEDGPGGGGDVPKVQAVQKMVVSDNPTEEEQSMWDWFLSLFDC